MSISHYPISRLIARAIQDQKWSAASLIKACGFRDLECGMRKLDHLCERAVYSDRLLKSLTRVLGLDPVLVIEAVECTIVMQREERQAFFAIIDRNGHEQFHPYLEIRTEFMVPRPVFATKFGGYHLRHISLDPAFGSLRGDFLLTMLKRIIVSHHTKRNGHVSAFGKILSYAYFHTSDSGLIFSVDGELHSWFNDQVHPQPRQQVPRPKSVETRM